jgi:AbiV family abortive infection protein
MTALASVLKDKNDNWVKKLPITEDLWKKTMQETRNRILRLLNAAEKFLDVAIDEAVCAGLYIFAVEEFGKLLILKQSLSTTNGIVEIRYKNKFRSHKAKFKKALANLPKECKILRTGFEEGFEEGFEYIETVTDFKARLTIFYTDFTDDGKDLTTIPIVSLDQLKITIGKLREITKATSIS